MLTYLPACLVEVIQGNAGGRYGQLDASHHRVELALQRVSATAGARFKPACLTDLS